MHMQLKILSSLLYVRVKCREHLAPSTAMLHDASQNSDNCHVALLLGPEGFVLHNWCNLPCVSGVLVIQSIQ